MYEQVSHSLLNEILIKLNPDIKSKDLRHFYTRLGANFYSIYTLFDLLYGYRDDFRPTSYGRNPNALDWANLIFSLVR